MSITRRVFLKNGALAIVATTAVPGFLRRAAFAAETAGAKKRLVVLFQRGAADGLNIVVPHGESAYYAMRPSIAIPRPGGNESAIDLDGFFGLHPSMASLKPLWGEKHLAIVHAAGSPWGTTMFRPSAAPRWKSTTSRFLPAAVSAAKAARRRNPGTAVVATMARAPFFRNTRRVMLISF